MDLKIPLNRLKFGQDDGAGINARVTGREQGIAELAANLLAQGQIENLIVRDAGDGFYAVANGNKRLAAFRMMYGAQSGQEINCTLHDVDQEKAFEFSLTTAITAAQLHPIDQYEAFARLDERGKTHDEIALQYGMTEKQVRQALALGRLSPKIRDAWRTGEIKAEIAKAFTLGLDHFMQDTTFAKLKKDGRLFESRIKAELAGDIDEDVAQLLDVVGADAYRAAGGAVIEDLFGPSHIISNEALLKQMARQLLIARCDDLVAAGWGWAEIESDLPKGARYWPKSEPKSLDYRDDEKSRIDDLKARLEAIHDQEDLSYNESEEIEQKLEREIDDVTSAVLARSFEDKKRKTLGCIVDIEDGRVIVLYGIKKPAEVQLPAAHGDDGPADTSTSSPAKKRAKAAAAEEPEISQALLHRLSVQLTKAAATALIQDEQLALSVLLAGFGCYSDCGVKVSVSGLGCSGGMRDRGVLGAEQMDKALPIAARLKPAERVTLLTQIAANALDFQNHSLVDDDRESGAVAICNAIDPKTLNAALRGAFDAKDYFAGVAKPLCLKAIEEAMGPDLARQQAKNPKGDIAAFAVENVPNTGWLPPQLRAKGYDGPPVKARSLASNAIGATTSPSPARAKGNVPKAMKDALKSAEKALKPLKRAAAARKAVVKNAAKTVAKKTAKKRKAS